MGDYTLTYPSFLQFILRKEFDPSENFTAFPSHKYDELDNVMVCYYLKRTLDQEKERQEDKREVYERITFQKNKHRLEAYWEEWKSTIYKALIIYMSKSSLTDKWGYVIRDVFLEKAIRYDQAIHAWDVKFAAHKPECAYGKAIRIIIVYNAQKAKLVGLRAFSLIVFILEQYIALEFQNKESSSYGGWTSYPSSFAS